MALIQTPTLLSQSLHESGIGSRVGNTPMLSLRRIARGLPQGLRLHAKAEWFNASGSVKDRPALNIIRTAIANGDLVPGKRLLDSTSGNMGIAYATICAAIEIPITLCVPANASPERVTILRSLGAHIVMTDPSEGSDGAIVVARKLAAEAPDVYWYANQYNNDANWQAHYKTTGPEIFAQTQGQLTHLVLGLGTSGTLMGTGRYMRECLPNVKIVAFQPDASFHGLEGLKHMSTSIQPGIYDTSFADQTLEIQTEAAYEMVRRLAREEGLLVGISSGAAMVASLRVASQLNEGLVVTLFPDAGYKYLSDKALWQEH
jgi:S-sulfo-L-cysteine synthase (O-acetyl-L-serine-dependent)